MEMTHRTAKYFAAKTAPKIKATQEIKYAADTEVAKKLNLLKIRVRSELPAGCIGYADFLMEENFPLTGQTANANLLRLEQLRPGTLSEFASAVTGF